MTYEQISQYMQAAFIYGDVTEAEHDAMPVSHFMTVVGGIRYIGADVAIDFLASKLIAPVVVEETPEQQ